jgi:hypothetical protein
MNNLILHDSFIREVLRLSNGGICKPVFFFNKKSCSDVFFPLGNSDRLTTRDITLSDGTFIPKGVFLSAVSTPLMADKGIYGEDAEKFNGFRFSDRRMQEGQENRYQLAQISPDYLVFGGASLGWWVSFLFFSS